MEKLYFAVQHGDVYDLDYGSLDRAEAIRMAEEMANDELYDGQEIRIATVYDGQDDVLSEEVIRAGSRTARDWDIV